MRTTFHDVQPLNGRPTNQEAAGFQPFLLPMRRNDEIYIHIDERMWTTWDRYPIHARIQEEEVTKTFLKGE